jgi:hypothetical protein
MGPALVNPVRRRLFVDRGDYAVERLDVEG